MEISRANSTGNPDSQPGAQGADHAGRDLVLEGLRGTAAIVVMLAHLATPVPHADGSGRLDPGYVPNWSTPWTGSASLGVLIFFVLSGYVIGRRTLIPASRPAILGYLRRRAVRILPIYWVGVALGLTFEESGLAGKALGHLLFLQYDHAESWTRLLTANPNLWSLAYEAAYYAALPVLWILRPRLWPLMVGGIVAALLQRAGISPAAPLCVLSGAVFWLLGLHLAWNHPAGGEQTSGKGPWPAVVLLALATIQADPLGTWGNRLFGPVPFFTGVQFRDLAALPSLAWLFSLLSGRRLRFARAWEMAAWFLPLSILVWRALRGTFDPYLNVPAALLGLAVVLRGLRVPIEGWSRLAPLGAVSYAVYAIGYPIQVAIQSRGPAWTGSFLTWVTRATAALILTLAAAWLLERVLQPRLNRLLNPPANPAASSG